MSRYDLVEIGTGTAAKKVALTCRRAGWSVAVIDHKPFGGTCPLRGCDPKRRCGPSPKPVIGLADWRAPGSTVGRSYRGPTQNQTLVDGWVKARS